MRTSIALVLVGELFALVSIAFWSPESAGIILGLQLVAVGLMREARAATKAKRPAKPTGKMAAGLHRRQASIKKFTSRGRPKFKLIRGAA